MTPYNSLSNCVSSLSASVALLNESCNTLDEAVADISRLKKVLSITKVFGLVPELDLENAKKNVRHEVGPKMERSLFQIRNELGKLERKRMNLISKADLQRVRLETFGANPRDLMVTKSVDESKLTRLRVLQNKKDRLKYSLSRMNLQLRLSTIPDR